MQKRTHKLITKLLTICYSKIGKKPASGDHESDDEINFLRLNNLIPKLKQRKLRAFALYGAIEKRTI